MDTQLVIVMRHGERRDAAPNAPAESNPPLTTAGKKDVTRAAHKLASTIGKDAARKLVIVVSPFARCVETAAELQRHGVGCDAPMIVDNTVCEVYGPARIKSKTAPELPLNVMINSVGELPAWGETLTQASERYVTSFLRNGDQFVSQLSREKSSALSSDAGASDIGANSVPSAVCARAQPSKRPGPHISGVAQAGRERATEYGTQGPESDPSVSITRAHTENVLIVTHGDALSAVMAQFYPARTVYEAEFLSFLVMKRYGGFNPIYHLDDSVGVQWIVDGVDGEPEDAAYAAVMRAAPPRPVDSPDDDPEDDPDEDFSDDDEEERAVPHSSVNRRVLPSTSSRSQRSATGQTTVVPVPSSNPPPPRGAPLAQGHAGPVRLFDGAGTTRESAPLADSHRIPSAHAVPDRSVAGAKANASVGQSTPTVAHHRGGGRHRPELPAAPAGTSELTNSGPAGASAGVSPNHPARHHRTLEESHGSAVAVASTSSPSGNSDLSSPRHSAPADAPAARVHPNGIEGCSKTQAPTEPPLQSSANASTPAQTMSDDGARAATSQAVSAGNDCARGQTSLATGGVPVGSDPKVPARSPNAPRALVGKVIVDRSGKPPTTVPSVSMSRQSYPVDDLTSNTGSSTYWLAKQCTYDSNMTASSFGGVTALGEDTSSNRFMPESGVASTRRAQRNPTTTVEDVYYAKRTPPDSVTDSPFCSAIPSSVGPQALVLEQERCGKKRRSPSLQVLWGEDANSSAPAAPQSSSSTQGTWPAALYFLRAGAVRWNAVQISFVLRFTTAALQLLTLLAWRTRGDAVRYVTATVAVESTQMVLLALSVRHTCVNKLRVPVEQCRWFTERNEKKHSAVKSSPRSNSESPADSGLLSATRSSTGRVTALPTAVLTDRREEDEDAGGSNENFATDVSCRLLGTARTLPGESVEEGVIPIHPPQEGSTFDVASVLCRQVCATTFKAIVVVVTALALAEACHTGTFTMPRSLFEMLTHALPLCVFLLYYAVNILRGFVDEALAFLE